MKKKQVLCWKNDPPNDCDHSHSVSVMKKIPIYVATDLKLSKQHLDEDEFIDVEEYTIDEIKDMIFSGKIIDAKTISGVLGYLNIEK